MPSRTIPRRPTTTRTFAPIPAPTFRPIPVLLGATLAAGVPASLAWGGAFLAKGAVLHHGPALPAERAGALILPGFAAFVVAWCLGNALVVIRRGAVSGGPSAFAAAHRRAIAAAAALLCVPTLAFLVAGAVRAAHAAHASALVGWSLAVVLALMASVVATRAVLAAREIDGLLCGRIVPAAPPGRVAPPQNRAARRANARRARRAVAA